MMEASQIRPRSPLPRSSQDALVNALHPAKCECMECVLGFARPIDEASEPVLYAAAVGIVTNDSGRELRVRVEW